MMRSRWQPRLFAVVAGLLAALSQPPVSWSLVLAVALPALFWLWRRVDTSRQAFWIGWFAGIGYFGGTLNWIAEPFLVEPEVFGWMIPFAVTGMAGGMALFWGAGFWIAKRIGSTGWGAPFALTFGLVGMEWLRGNILTGFPWSLLGYAWVETPVMLLAADIGIYGVTLWTVLTGMLIGAILIAGTARTKLVFAVLSVAVLIGPVAPKFFLSLNLMGKNPSSIDGPKIGLVQPNVAQRDKWQPALRQAHLRDLLDKTRALSAQGADVVIWPEAATPYQFDQAPQLRAMVADALGPDAILLAGAIRFDGDKAFNSLVAVGADGTILDTYDKQHLVPFGERMPFHDTLSHWGIDALAALPGGMTPGAARERRLEVAGLPPFVPMICYEAIFPAEIMRRDAGESWMVQVTNDAWFGNWVGPYQHFAMARVRAIERGLPVARAANTGVSALIDGYGRVLAALPLNEAGILLHPLPIRAQSTAYARFEDIPFGLGLLLTGLIGWLERRSPLKLR